jgi:hypothetical protein
LWEKKQKKKHTKLKTKPARQPPKTLAATPNPHPRTTTTKKNQQKKTTIRKKKGISKEPNKTGKTKKTNQTA